ncbi:reverse transcriptase domain-containing protein [Tanacetum coccineum]|uniref:Reverse transcriptase domain-containing protein n=1 Tax=Tanacetum coccineum TaxID=301880 RepID=A0ABQ5B9B2_9ASTR
MRTRSQARISVPEPPVRQPSVESSNLEKPDNPPIVTMADNRTMAQLLEAPTEGYEDAIVIPEITANNFEIKHGLLNLVQNKQFFGHDKEDPHAHIRYFNKITSTMKIPNVPNTSVKLMLFPFSLEGAARIWLEKEPPRSIETWDDLVSKFINKFFPPSKTTNLRNEITRFQQKFDETFYEAWDRFNDLLRGCPHHGFSELHQLDTFYNALNSNDQDSLNSAAGGNFLDKMPPRMFKNIESKSKLIQLPTSGSGTLPVNTVTNPKEDLKSTEDVQPPVIQIQSRNPNPEPNVAPNVYGGEITLRVGKEAITFNLDQTSKYTADYDHMTANKIDVIEMACDEYSQEVLGFSNVVASGNPTPYFEPIVSTASPTHSVSGQKELKLCEAKTVESSVNEPPEVELKELPNHLEYAFLEGDDKLPVH